MAALQLLARRDDADINVGEAALLLAARDRPGVSLDRYRDHLEKLADDAAAAYAQSEGSGAAKHEALNQVIAGDHGYAGDSLSYDDLQNANLMRVIDRRKGLPIALGILYLYAGRALGWHIEGLNFPGHFLLRLEAAGERIIFDPFNGGKVIEISDMRALLKATRGGDAELLPEHYTPASNRDILIRLQNNKKVRLLKAKQVAEALTVVEDMLVFAPGSAGLWHEAGVLHSHLGNIRAALVALEQCQDLSTSPQDKHRVAQLIGELRNRLN
ncbi:MAG: tetratricopeptide repeat protein [Alphaproteobacteria bacterium]|nr:tetratricopeptide repeat protein [Alphaproteobacteria bacterium]